MGRIARSIRIEDTWTADTHDIHTCVKFFTSHNGDKTPLPVSDAASIRRLTKLREIMTKRDSPVVLTFSMHNIAYCSGFLYCSFGRL